jgi:hypothetical protein
MNKKLVFSEVEFFNIFKDLEDVEEFLGIEFAYKDGSYEDGNYDNENQEIDDTVYRKLEYNMFPNSYPCIVIYFHEDYFDRMGDVSTRLLDFVYPADFFNGDKNEKNRIRSQD